MAFLKKRSKLPAAIVKGILFFILMGAVLAGFYFLYQKQMKEMQVRYDEEINQIRFDLYLLDRQVLVPKKDIQYGTLLVSELFRQENRKLDIPQDRLLDETDMGKTNTVLLPAGIPVMKTAAAAEKMANDIREQEFNMFLIQTNQMDGDFIDVRIVFPNGENYIVLSKKQLKGLNREENTLWLWVDETEIHKISSAIVDAYLHPGTKLTVSTYIQPEVQEAAIPYYPANPEVLDLIRKDPNVLQKAGDSLAREARAALEIHLQELSLDEQSKVESGVHEEKRKNLEQIKNLKSDPAQPEGEQGQPEIGETTNEENSETNSFQ